MNLLDFSDNLQMDILIAFFAFTVLITTHGTFICLSIICNNYIYIITNALLIKTTTLL
jgi:hypothetical protein